mgnify:CR=1 FL=1
MFMSNNFCFIILRLSVEFVELLTYSIQRNAIIEEAYFGTAMLRLTILWKHTKSDRALEIYK